MLRLIWFIAITCLVGCVRVVVVGDVVNALRATGEDVLVAGRDAGRPLVARLAPNGHVVWRWTDQRRSDIEALEVVGDEVFALAMDCVLTRLDARTLGGPGFDVAKAARVDARGNIYVVGSMQGIVPRADDPAITQGHLEAFLTKLSPSGDVVWQRIEPSVLSWNTLDLDGNRVLAVGHFEGTAHIDQCTVRSQGATDTLVVRFDLDGHCLRARAFGGPESDYGYAVTSRPGGIASGGLRHDGFILLDR